MLKSKLRCDIISEPTVSVNLTVGLELYSVKSVFTNLSDIRPDLWLKRLLCGMYSLKNAFQGITPKCRFIGMVSKTVGSGFKS